MKINTQSEKNQNLDFLLFGDIQRSTHNLSLYYVTKNDTFMTKKSDKK